MLENLQAALSMSSQKALTQFMALIGDPIGRLETVQDLVEFSASLRNKKVQRSRIGVLLSADYEICTEVLKSPNWLTYPDTNNFVEKILFGNSQSSDNIDLFLDSILGKDGDEHA